VTGGKLALAELRDTLDEEPLGSRQEGASVSGRFVDVSRHVRNHSRFFEPSDGVRGMTVRVDFLHQQFGARALTRVFRRAEPTVREALLAELQVSEVELEDRWQRWMTSH
jgi:hypothetical protein